MTRRGVVLALSLAAQFAGAFSAAYFFFASTTDPLSWARRHLYPH